MIVLGVSAFFHDAAACLVVDGRVVAAAQEERFSRIKHDASVPVRAARFCLEQAGLTINDVDHVVFYEKPIRKFERILVTQLRSFPRGLGQFTRSMATWLGDRLWMKSNLAKALGCSSERILFCEHHLSHAASAFLPTDLEESAVVTVDGVGEWATTSIFHATSNDDGQPELRLLKELTFPHSIGLFYSALTAYLGFRVNSGEYKVMGLSAFGRPRFVDELMRTCCIGADGSFKTSDRYFAWSSSTDRGYTRALEDLLGPARRPGSPLALEPGATDPEAQRFADVAASAQLVLERAMVALAREAKALTGSQHLCMAGGVALNSVANRAVAEAAVFDRVVVHPAAGDAGGSLGAALYVSQVAGGDRRVAQPTRFLGAAHTPEEVHSTLSAAGVASIELDDERLMDEVAERLARGQAGAMSRGRFEWGPRALGARSILADPRQVAMRDRVNGTVKRREPFRPFAPSVLDDNLDDWFEPGRGADQDLLGSMLSVVPAKDRAAHQVPAVVHVDGSARVHAVGTDQPDLRGVLEGFEARTGVPILLHTSLNLKDEPMCGSALDTWATFARTDLDFLVLGRCLVDRRPS